RDDDRSVVRMSAAVTESATPVSFTARGPLEDFWRRFRRDRVALAATTFIVLVVIGAIGGAPAAAWLTGHPPDRQYVNGLTIDGIPLPPLAHECGSGGIHPN